MKPDAVELEITQLAAGGYGLARTADGIVFVRGGLPGERVTARPRLSGGVLKAHAIDVLEPHPARVDLDLPPGADLPLRYDAQLPLKEALVREALERIGKLDAGLEPIAPSPCDLGYRTAAQYAATPDGLAARATESNAVVPIRRDSLVCDDINGVIGDLAQRSLHGVGEVAFRASILEGRVIVGLLSESVKIAERHARAIHSAGVVWSEIDARGRFRGGSTLLSGTDRLMEDFGGISTTVTVQSFAQVNPPAAGMLYREAATIAGRGRRAIDLYAGGGVLGFHIAASYDEVMAVEIATDAVRCGRSDARRLGVGNLTFQKGDARAVGKLLPADLVALDPPRAGLGKDVVEILAEQGPDKILYVSCDPVTWARDAGRLAAAGYRITFARPYDFYPYTHHVEVLSLLQR